jgi:hypothetical protein
LSEELNIRPSGSVVRSRIYQAGRNGFVQVTALGHDMCVTVSVSNHEGVEICSSMVQGHSFLLIFHPAYSGLYTVRIGNVSYDPTSLQLDTFESVPRH